jgi:2-succinyl-6-hydroxy-2,4-cyclohexadiene-1-carboxylate synthase
MPFIEAAGERMWYETYGDPHLRPVLALHGFTGNHSAWEALAVSPLGRAIYLVAPDLYGHGWSSTPEDVGRLRLSRMAADLWALWDALEVGDPVVLGYSMGGRLAIDLALHTPARVPALILESASPGIQDPAEREARRRADEALADRIEQQGVEAFVEYWEHLPLFQSQRRLNPALLEQVHRDRLANTAHGLAQSLRGSGTGAQPSRWEALAELTMPTLLVTGAEDEKYRAIHQQMARLLPAAQTVVLDGAGHTPHLEQPDAFVETLGAFLRANGLITAPRG